MRWTVTLDGKEVTLRSVSDYSINEWSKYLRQNRKGGTSPMGMFDKEVQLTKAIQNGDVPPVFVLLTAEYMGRVDSAEYGPNDKARVTVGDPDSGQTLGTFVVFGVMAQQCQRVEPGDLPQRSQVGQDGRANVLEPVSE